MLYEVITHDPEADSRLRGIIEELVENHLMMCTWYADTVHEAKIPISAEKYFEEKEQALREEKEKLRKEAEKKEKARLEKEEKMHEESMRREAARLEEISRLQEQMSYNFV